MILLNGRFNKDFFKSRTFLNHLQTLARNFTGNFKLKVVFGDGSYTDGNVITINPDEGSDLDFKDRVRLIESTVIHECLHLIRTNFEVFQEYMAKEREKNVHRASISREFLNIVEDAYIEFMAQEDYPYYYADLEWSNSLYANSFKELKGNALTQFQHLMLYYAVCKRDFGAFCKDQTVLERYEKAKSFLDLTYKYDSPMKARISITEKLLELAKDWIDDYLKDRFNPDLQPQFTQIREDMPSIGSSHPSQSQGYSLVPSKTPSPEQQKMKQQQMQGIGQGTKEQKEEKKTGNTQTSSVKENKEEKEKKEQGEAVLNPQNNEVILDDPNEEKKDKGSAQEQNDDRQDNASKPQNDSNPPTEENSDSEKPNDQQEKREDQSNQATSLEEQNDSQRDPQELDQLMDSFQSEQKEDENALKEFERNSRQGEGWVTSRGFETHLRSGEDISPTSLEVHDLTEYYRELCSNNRLAINNLVKEFEALQIEDPSYIRNRLVGTKLDLKKAYKREPEKMMAKRRREDQYDPAILMTVDLSGSTRKLIRIYRETFVLFNEFCKRANIPFAILGHNISGGSNVNQIQAIKLFEDKRFQDEDVLRFEVRGNTREDMTLAWSAHYFAKQSKKDKLMICLSDGQPEHYFQGVTFTGEYARKEIRNAEKIIESLDIEMVGLGLGVDLKGFYRSTIYIEKVDQLPRVLSKFMKERIRGW